MRKAELFLKPLIVQNQLVNGVTSLELKKKKSFLKCVFRECFFF